MLAPMPETIVSPWPWMDKLEHLLAYAALTQLWLARRPVSTSLAMGIVLYSVLLEGAQGFTSYRAVDAMDVLANAMGVGLSLGFTWLWRSQQHTRQDLV